MDESIDGSAALQKLRDKSYGLVISDWNMEPMSGLQLLKEVRADVKLKEVPFIMITAESKSENVIAAKEAGVSNYIVKPFNAATLKGKLDALRQAASHFPNSERSQTVTQRMSDVFTALYLGNASA